MAPLKPPRQGVKTYLHHTLVRVQFAELLLDLVHAFLNALLLSQQALLEKQKKKERKV